LALPAAAWAANGHANYHAVCPGPPTGYAHCHVLVVTDSHDNPAASLAPTGLPPGTIQSVYGFPAASTSGAGQTIALVDAYDDPTAEKDLNVFSSQYGLPACTTANGCFSKVNQTGGTSYPQSDSNWALEVSLDIQWAHAIAPAARILLVEASSNSFANLLAAEDYAKTHAQYVSDSWGGSEFSGESSYDSHFVGSGVSFFVSAGDAGLPAEYPSASPNVISVGGTTLNFNAGGSFVSETGWSSGGGGCSRYEFANAAQSGFAGSGQAGCGGARATPDVALDADPSSGVSVYDSTPYSGQSGWFTVGGTSAASPMWAAGSADAGAVVNAGYVYGNSVSYRDITAGNNGAPCLVGYDLCSGRGSWLYGASSPPPGQGALSFASPAQALTAGTASAAMQLAVSAAQTTDVIATVSSSSVNGAFATSPSGPWASTLSLTITAGQTASPSFYYEDTSAGSPKLTASGSGVSSGSQTETVNAAGLSSITVSPGTTTLAVGGSQTFTAVGKDQYGNAVGVANASWTTNAPGSLSPSSGSSTVFTAGSSPGGGTVTAAVGSSSGSATVTVTSLSAMTVTITAGSLTRQGSNYHVPLTVAARNASSGLPLSGAAVTVQFYAGSTCSGSVAARGTGTTASNGQVVFTFTTRQARLWCALSTVSSSGYQNGSAQTTFST
jgi:subtilase family serine protease